jgi:polyisoprenoid-binding protein YceI
MLLGLLLLPLNASASDRYEIDSDHATVGFLVKHVGFAKVLGSFADIRGDFQFDEAQKTVKNVRVVIPTATVDTRVQARDRHLKSADFLNVEQYPEMVFESEGTTLDESGSGRLIGQLTLLGLTREVSLEVSWNRSAISPIPVSGENPYVLGASARGVLKRSDFGMDYGLAEMLVGDEIELILEIEARRMAD